MIFAKTDMEQMPETCFECDLNGAKGAQCAVLGVYINRNGRHRACPLVQIDDEQVLPEHDDRLGNGG